LQEKALLLQEVHHRVKNNLQIIYGLLSMQANRADSEEVKEQLVEVKNRIFSISLIHEELYQSENFAMIDVDRYCRKLCESLAAVYKTDHQVELILQVESGIQVGIDHATPLGLLINEVLCNSYKHAFKGGNAGKIWLKGFATDEHYTLEIKDNGKGADPDAVKAKAGNSLGNKLISGLAQQLRAKLEVSYENGYSVRFTIPRTHKQNLN
jgi:two-component sensor histidine kinase